MATQKKIETVQKLTDKVARARTMVITDYTGLKHKQLEELRKSLKKVKAEFTVTKNTLLKKALSENKKTISEDLLNASTGALFAYEDEAAPVKTLADFFKAAASGKIRGGLLGQVKMTEAEVQQLASLPSREILLSKLVGQLMAPVSGLHNALSWNIRKLVWTLDGIKSKKLN